MIITVTNVKRRKTGLKYIRKEKLSYISLLKDTLMSGSGKR